MASKIWLNLRGQIPLRDSKTANIYGNHRHHHLKDLVVIAKGNSIEGIEAQE